MTTNTPLPREAVKAILIDHGVTDISGALLDALAGEREPAPSSERDLMGQAEGICTIPPEGWWCSRQPGHEGPCAARPIEAPREEPLTDEETAIIDRAWERHKAASTTQEPAEFHMGGAAAAYAVTESARPDPEQADQRHCFGGMTKHEVYFAGYRDASTQEPALDLHTLEERDGLPQCWIVWAMKPGQDNPRVIAICTDEATAARYEQATDAFPGFRLAKEQAPMNHTFGAADLRSVAHRAALRKVRSQ